MPIANKSVAIIETGMLLEIDKDIEESLPQSRDGPSSHGLWIDQHYPDSECRTSHGLSGSTLSG